MQFFTDKLSVPTLDEYVQRPRLDRLLVRALDKIGAVLITGRTGTGKTSLAANYAQKYDRVIWYRIESADNDWQIFSTYFSAVMMNGTPAGSNTNVPTFVESLFMEASRHPDEPVLLVLDDLHNIFDAEWFVEFYLTLLNALPQNIHLVSLSRSLPALPLWRLRSKQALSVIEENILAFDEKETEALCKDSGITIDRSAKLCAQAFGRVGKLKALLQTI